MTRHSIRLALALFTLGIAAPLAAEDETPLDEYIRANFTKFQHRIPMRDGVRLFTAVYVPNDRSRTYPILMKRTPYSVAPYGPDRYPRRLGPTADFPREGFIFVEQDVRGRSMSEGTFVNMRPHHPDKRGASDIDESTDTYDTIEWLLANVDRHNGRVGQWGISYPGFYASAGMIDSHPALRAVSPQAPIADWFIGDDMHHHGAFILPLGFNFFSRFGQRQENPTTKRSEPFDHHTEDGYQFFLDLGPLRHANERYFKGEIAFWNRITEHPNYDAFWQSRNIVPHLRNIGCAVMVVGGWFDTEDLYGPLATYRAVEENNPGIFNVLVMGPWSHGGWSRASGDALGTADFGFATSEYYREHVVLPFFKHFLADEGDLDLPEALVFETGANRWRSFDAWPPPARRERRLYLGEAGGLSFEPPTASEGASDAYVSDPARPVPYTMEIATRWTRNHMTEDQRFAAWRPDVVVYQTDVLTEDLTVAGPITAELWVSTTGQDADWIVKVIDAYPGENPNDVDDEAWPGHRQMLVRAEVMRGRFRESYEEPRPMVPDTVTRVSFELRDAFHTFKRGHRLMVHIQSTWFPFVDRNPQSWVPNIFEATEEDFIAVTNRVHRSREHPSLIRVGILE